MVPHSASLLTIHLNFQFQVDPLIDFKSCSWQENCNRWTKPPQGDSFVTPSKFGRGIKSSIIKPMKDSVLNQYCQELHAYMLQECNTNEVILLCALLITYTWNLDSKRTGCRHLGVGKIMLLNKSKDIIHNFLL